MYTSIIPAEMKAKVKVETTINIDKELYEKLKEAAKKYGVSRSRLISLLMKIFVNREEPDEENYTQNTVQYQEARDADDWKTLHLVIYKPDYEFFDDVRKLWKKSFSLLVAYVFEKYFAYLDQFPEEDFTDNYRDIAYFTRYFIENDVPYLLLCWQVPQTPITIPPG